MPAVTFAEAARRLGLSSRSGLYRLKDSGQLSDYLRPGPGSAQLLELAPPDLPSLEAHLATILDPGRGPWTARRERRERRDQRWDVVASVLSEALAEVSGPALTAREAQLLAERLGPACQAVFPEGLPGLAAVDNLALQELWAPMTLAVNRGLASQGWRLPPLTGAELQLLSGEIDDQREGTVWDTDSVAWWEAENASPVPGHPSPDPWRCEHCGEPWHPSHPEHRHSEHVAAFWRERLASLRRSPAGTLQAVAPPPCSPPI